MVYSEPNGHNQIKLTFAVDGVVHARVLYPSKNYVGTQSKCSKWMAVEYPEIFKTPPLKPLLEGEHDGILLVKRLENHQVKLIGVYEARAEYEARTLRRSHDIFHLAVIFLLVSCQYNRLLSVRS